MAAILWTEDAIVCGVLLSCIGLVFYTQGLPIFRRFYSWVPPLALCYLLPAVGTQLGLFSPHESQLYYVASRYFLPTSLVLLTLSVQFRLLFQLGPRLLWAFLIGTLGVALGGVVALLLGVWSHSSLFESYTALEVVHGFATLMGSWIGGGANQAAMKEIFHVSTELFGIMLLPDIVLANLLLSGLLIGAAHHARLDRWLRARAEPLEALERAAKSVSVAAPSPINTRSLLMVLGFGLGVTAVSHLAAATIVPLLTTHYPQAAQYNLTSPFFWLILVSTLLALVAARTPLRRLHGHGAAEVGNAMLYFLVATIGMGMDLSAIWEHVDVLWLGTVWIAVHIAVLVGYAKYHRLPFFFVALASQANVGGVVSASIVAAAMRQQLVPLAVLIAVIGYVIGTYVAYFTTLILAALIS